MEVLENCQAYHGRSGSSVRPSSEQHVTGVIVMADLQEKRLSYLSTSL